MSHHAEVTFHESWVDRQIREAMERGEFDDLPGTGKPLDLGDVDDPDWWVKAKMKREGIDTRDAVTGVLALRREAATFPESLLEIGSPDGVREVLRDYNHRVVQDRLRPVTGRHMPAVAPRIDVEAMVLRWQELRSAAARDTENQAAPTPDQDDVRARPPWWRRWRRGTS